MASQGQPPTHNGNMGKSFLTNESLSLLGFKLSSSGDATVTLSSPVLAGRNISLAAKLNLSCFILSPLHLISSGHRELYLLLPLMYFTILSFCSLFPSFSSILSRPNKCNSFGLSLEDVLVDICLIAHHWACFKVIPILLEAWSPKLEPRTLIWTFLNATWKDFFTRPTNTSLLRKLLFSSMVF